MRELDAQRIDAAILYSTIVILWEEECTDPELSAAAGTRTNAAFSPMRAENL